MKILNLLKIKNINILMKFEFTSKKIPMKVSGICFPNDLEAFMTNMAVGASTKCKVDVESKMRTSTT
jgi:hypothetical protein